MSRTRFLLSLLALSAALAIGSDYAVAHEYGPIGGHTQTLEHATAPDGGLVQVRATALGALKVEVQSGSSTAIDGVVTAVITARDGGIPFAKTEEQGGYAKTAGCVEVACNTNGACDAGNCTLDLATEVDYELTNTTNSPVRLSNGAPCVAFASGTGVGKVVNEGAARYWRAPAGFGTDGGVAKNQCCALTAHSAAAPVIVQACPR